jgi:hypothetical protein
MRTTRRSRSALASEIVTWFGGCDADMRAVGEHTGGHVDGRGVCGTRQGAQRQSGERQGDRDPETFRNDSNGSTSCVLEARGLAAEALPFG